MGHLFNFARYDTIRDGKLIKDTTRTIEGSYNENLAAFYTGFTYQRKRLGLMMGLRIEHTHLNVTDGKSHYYNFQPNIAFNYQGKFWTSLLKLTSTLDRPAYTYLNNAKTYINDYSYRKGNLDIRPSRQYRISLENNVSDFADLSFGYIRIEDQIIIVGRQKANEPYVVLRPENAAAVNDYYLNVSGYYNLFKEKLQGHFSAYGEVYGYQLPDNLNPANIKGFQKYGTLSWINGLKITRKLKLETDLFVRSNAHFYQVNQRHRWQADAGLEYSLNSHWNFAVKFFNLFATYKYDYTKFYDEYTDHFQHNPHTNKLRLSIIYRFDKNSNKIKKVQSAIDKENSSRFDL